MLKNSGGLCRAGREFAQVLFGTMMWVHTGVYAREAAVSVLPGVHTGLTPTPPWISVFGNQDRRKGPIRNLIPVLSLNSGEV